MWVGVVNAVRDYVAFRFLPALWGELYRLGHRKVEVGLVSLRVLGAEPPCVGEPPLDLPPSCEASVIEFTATAEFSLVLDEVEDIFSLHLQGRVMRIRRESDEGEVYFVVQLSVLGYDGRWGREITFLRNLVLTKGCEGFAPPACPTVAGGNLNEIANLISVCHSPQAEIYAKIYDTFRDVIFHALKTQNTFTVSTIRKVNGEKVNCLGRWTIYPKDEFLPIKFCRRTDEGGAVEEEQVVLRIGARVVGDIHFDPSVFPPLQSLVMDAYIAFSWWYWAGGGGKFRLTPALILYTKFEEDPREFLSASLVPTKDGSPIFALAPAEVARKTAEILQTLSPSHIECLMKRYFEGVVKSLEGR